MSELEPGKPCLMCGVRSDIACRHRPAEAGRPPPPEQKEDGRKRRDWTGNGRNFHVRKRV
jgi:hypothetical protein